jgi:predicted NBD/HSP70 family sugar kinase/mannose-6-phosphate isomerase class I
MKPTVTILGIDVGGSHITAALIHQTQQGWLTSFSTHITLDATSPANNIVNTIQTGITTVLTKTDSPVDTLGIAFPGPFDYETGVSCIAGVGGKFESIFGLHLLQAIQDIPGLHDATIKFSNDAHCFATGAYQLLGLNSKRTIFITLGTGFGSAFLVNGKLVQAGSGIPSSGAFYDQDFEGAKADDLFSTRWILDAYQAKTGNTIGSVKALASIPSDAAREVMSAFGNKLGQFLLPWLQSFHCDELIIGGNIARAFPLFAPSLKNALEPVSSSLHINSCENTEDCTIAGAAIIAAMTSTINNTPLPRKTLQPVLPVTTISNETAGYTIYPSFASGKKVYEGFTTLAAALCHEKIIIIDGYGGVLWEHFRAQLHTALLHNNKKVFWYDISACMKPVADIQAMVAVNLNGNDPVFGKKYEGTLTDFFDEHKLRLLSPDETADICIIYGTGASLANVNGKLVYVDVPKNEIQFRMKAGSIRNYGNLQPDNSAQMYKQFYFVDWPVFNKHKAQLLPRLDFIVDEQRITNITWMNGNCFRTTLDKMLEQPFRARPWFEPGVWGGDWMKRHIPQLNQQELNYAWSFELITPENGIVLEGDNNLLEVSFDFLLFAGNQKLLGKAARRFGTEFPIRFDFLDTFNGGNLSVQCHPRPAYAKEHFGENFTQDETYYILDCSPDASVYLGFRESINKDEFETALFDAQQKAMELDVEKYIQKLPSHQHELFLIPNGTIHASGINNLVLEISSTPYIFTFKCYDWLRPGLNGQPRPINIEHAMKNLYFDRKGQYVTEKLIAHPITETEWTGGKKINLPTHEEHFYSVHRYEFNGSITIDTYDQCQVCMLVQGTNIRVRSGDSDTIFYYTETFVIPAATGVYELTSPENETSFVVVAQVKEDHC